MINSYLLPLYPTITAFSLCLFDRFPTSTKSLHDRPLPLHKWPPVLPRPLSRARAADLPTISPFTNPRENGVGVRIWVGWVFGGGWDGAVVDDFVEVGNRWINMYETLYKGSKSVYMIHVKQVFSACR